MSCQRILRSFRVPATVLLGAVAAFSSCKTVDRAVNGPVEALVVVPSAQAGRNEQYIVEASAGRSCKAGVRAMRNADWDLAITGFQQALLADPEDREAHFGLGVAYELTGELGKALEHYEAAARLSPEPDPAYAMSIDRVRAKLGR